MSAATFTAPSYVVQDSEGNVVAGMQFTIWTAKTGGTQVTSLQDLDGDALPGYVTSDEKGRVWFADPAARDVLYAQPPGTPVPARWLLVSDQAQINVGQAITQAAQAYTVASEADTKADSAVITATAADGRSQEAIATANNALRIASTVVSVNVDAFGAVGDGTTDDTAAFQAAIDAIDSIGGGTLLLSPRTYRVASADEDAVPLYLVNDLTIEGYGATLTKAHSDTFRALFTNQDTGGLGYGSTNKNITVRGVRFLGDFAGGVTICPFAFNHVQNLTVEDCVFEQCQGRSGHCFDLCGCETVRVRRCTFIGMAIEGTGDPIAETVQLGASAYAGVTSGTPRTGFDGIFTRDVEVSDCRFLPVTVGGTDYPCGNPIGAHNVTEGRYYEQVKFLRNYVQDPIESISDDDTNDGRAYYRGVVHMPTVHGFECSGNMFVQTKPRANRVISSCGKASGILASSDPNAETHTVGQWAAPVVSTDVVIRDNTMIGFGAGSTGDAQENIYVRGIDSVDGSGAMRNITIDGNTFKDSWTAGASGSINKANVYLQNVLRATVSGNKIENGTCLCRVYTSQSVTIVGNVVDGLGDYIVYVPDASKRVTIIGNTVSGWSRPIQVAVLTGCQIANNTLNGPGTPVASGDGIVVVSGSGIQCVGNSIVNAGTAQDRGIVIGSGLTNSIIANNVIIGYTMKVSGSSSNNVTIAGNI